MSRRVLVVDDDRATCNLLRTGLTSEGLEVQIARNARAALAALDESEFDVLVTDINMGTMSGIDLCNQVCSTRPDLPVILITAFGTLDAAVGALRAGAYDFITKPFNLSAVAAAVERAARYHELRQEVRRLRQISGRRPGFGNLIGNSDAMRATCLLLQRVAESNAPVLITGESGTGKQTVARELHRHSRGPGVAFLSVNCAAVSETQLVEQLNALAGNHNVSTSSVGTLFLDEIGALPPELQPKLLQALEEPSGSSGVGEFQHPLRARLIAATEQDLESMIDEGHFREDLYYRLNVITIGLPPLRARKSDILLLAQYFLELISGETGKPVLGLSTAAAERLNGYSWPGNVRELRSCIERAVTVTRLDQIAVEDLPAKLRSSAMPNTSVPPCATDPLPPLEHIERAYILRVMKSVGGNKSLAAETLGLSRKTLYRKLAEYGLDSD